MNPLSHCRRWLLRSRRALTVLWLLAGILVVGGVPRWEVHAHAWDQHDAAHDAGGHAADPLPQSSADGVVTHAHLTPAMAATLPAVMVARLLNLPPDRWPGAAVPEPPLSGVVLPLHRPPIA